MRLQCVRVWSTLCSQCSFGLYRCLHAPQVPRGYFFFFSSVTCSNPYEVYVCGQGNAQGCILYLLDSIHEAFWSGPRPLHPAECSMRKHPYCKRRHKADLICVCFDIGFGVFIFSCVCLCERDRVSLYVRVLLYFVCAILLLITRDYLWPPLTSSASLSSQPVKPVIPAGKPNDIA